MASFSVVSKDEIAAQRSASHPTLRCLTSELGCLTRQDGSVSLSQGDTTALVVTYGPAEVRVNRELIYKATVDVIYKPKIGLPGPSERKREQIIRNTIETALLTQLHPRSSITLIVQETEDLGSNLACCVNAACLALLDAAVSMKFMVAAVSTVVVESGAIVVDPTKDDENDAKAIFTFIFESRGQNIITVLSSGQFSPEEYIKCKQAACQISQSIFDFYRDSLKKKDVTCF